MAVAIAPDGEMQRVIDLICGMEFNEAAYRRRYHLIAPLRHMFTRPAINQAVATLFQRHQSNLGLISASGYELVVKQVLLDHSCTEKAVPEIPIPLENGGMQLAVSKQSGFQNPRKRKVGVSQEPLLLCSKGDGEHKGDDRVKAGREMLLLEARKKRKVDEQVVKQVEAQVEQAPEQVEEMEVDVDMAFEESRPGEWSIAAEGVPKQFETYRLREMVELRCARDLEVVPEDTLLVKETRRRDSDDAVVVTFTSVLLAELVLDACSSVMVMAKPVPVRRSYPVSGIECLRRSFDVEEMDRSRLVYVSGLPQDWTQSELELRVQGLLKDAGDDKAVRFMVMLPGSSEVVMELRTETLADLFMYRCEQLVPKDAVVFRSRIFVPQIVRSSLDNVEAGQDDSSDVDVVDDQPGPSSPDQPPGFCKVDQPPGFSVEDNTEELEVPETVVEKSAKQKIEVRLLRPKPPEVDEGKKYVLDSYHQRTLYVRNLHPGYDLHHMRCFFRDAMMVESIPCPSRTAVARVEFDSEAAADALMDAYIDRPEDFKLDDTAFSIYRAPKYVRPGGVNKRDEPVADEKPGRVVVRGVPTTIPSRIVKAALCELLDRHFAADGSVTEYGFNLLNDFSREGPCLILSFYTRAAAKALLSLKATLKLAGRKLSFSPEHETPKSVKAFDKGDLQPQRKLILRNVVKGFDPVALRNFFQRFLRPDEYCFVEVINTCAAILHLGSEAAADKIMNSFVENPREFQFEGGGLSIYRDKYYYRPGSVNKRFQSSVDESPENVMARGFPSLERNVLRSILCELLDRAFSENPRVSECGAGLLKQFFINQTRVAVLSFHSSAAAEAALSLGKSVKLAGQTLQFYKASESEFDSPREENHRYDDARESYSREASRSRFDRRESSKSRFDEPRGGGRQRDYSRESTEETYERNQRQYEAGFGEPFEELDRGEWHRKQRHVDALAEPYREDFGQSSRRRRVAEYLPHGTPPEGYYVGDEVPERLTRFDCRDAKRRVRMIPEQQEARYSPEVYYTADHPAGYYDSRYPFREQQPNFTSYY